MIFARTSKDLKFLKPAKAKSQVLHFSSAFKIAKRFTTNSLTTSGKGFLNSLFTHFTTAHPIHTCLAASKDYIGLSMLSIINDVKGKGYTKISIA